MFTKLSNSQMHIHTHNKLTSNNQGIDKLEVKAEAPESLREEGLSRT